jgi:hypothetical protein
MYWMHFQSGEDSVWLTLSQMQAAALRMSALDPSTRGPSTYPAVAQLVDHYENSRGHTYSVASIANLQTSGLSPRSQLKLSTIPFMPCNLSCIAHG